MLWSGYERAKHARAFPVIAGTVEAFFTVFWIDATNLLKWLRERSAFVCTVNEGREHAFFMLQARHADVARSWTRLRTALPNTAGGTSGWALIPQDCSLIDITGYDKSVVMDQ
ncbi:predicted protein [Histoplasma capsulatum G186AR]|uniref:Uncharacterized protein n=1 Tax=Ajellomyces capsulatus (strain G186AR / H82 / ATCC MYA-2454 / RMSCC 2432) TaxID=447093 RepID=C0NVZ8_AJECG|nr:uncharacterized protein HCBG_07328 [Histoplasma capsulatum G186AR]EEH04687.1 predicted protein [Histoplasma capsulatum G186AR]